MIARRTLLRGLGALLAAPAIVRVGSLMPVSVWREEAPFSVLDFIDQLRARGLGAPRVYSISGPPMLLSDYLQDMRGPV